jgi:hypothetical protein
MAADDAARFLANAQATDAGPEAVTLLHNEVRRIAHAFGVEGGPALLPSLLSAQRFAFRCLDGPAIPDNARDLYFLAGVICGLLAHAGLDLGQIDAAMTQTRTALLCADRAGHQALMMRVRNEQCSIVRWAGWHHESLRYAQLGAAGGASVRGTVAIGRAVREARAHAALGDAERTRAALSVAAVARERMQPDELDELGGFLTHPPALESIIAADALSLLPDPVAAQRAAADAVAQCDAASADDISFGDRANAHVHLALARVRGTDVDGALDALRPVLSLPPAQRVYGVVANVRRVYSSLNDPRFHGSPTARGAAAEIEAFSQAPAQVALPE